MSRWINEAQAPKGVFIQNCQIASCSTGGIKLNGTVSQTKILGNTLSIISGGSQIGIYLRSADGLLGNNLISDVLIQGNNISQEGATPGTGVLMEAIDSPPGGFNGSVKHITITGNNVSNFNNGVDRITYTGAAVDYINVSTNNLNRNTTPVNNIIGIGNNIVSNNT